MKRMKKLFAILMTMAMVMGLGITGFAAESVDITIQNAKNATLWYDRVVVPATNKSTGWDFASQEYAEAFLEAFGYNDDTDTNRQIIINGMIFDATDGDAGDSVVNFTDNYADALNTIVEELPIDNTVPPAVGDATDRVLSVSEPGLYVITGQEQNYVYSPMAAYVGVSYTDGKPDGVSVTEPIEINAKKQPTTTDKDVTDQTEEDGVTEIGRTLTYTITGTVPYFNNPDTDKYWVEDVILKGAKYKEVTEGSGTVAVTVTVGGVVIMNNVPISIEKYAGSTQKYLGKDSFKINLTEAIVKNKNNTYANQEIVVSYQAVVTDVLLENDAMYGDGTNDGKYGTDTKKLITGEVIFEKTDGTNKLNGAQFVLTNGETDADKLKYGSFTKTGDENKGYTYKFAGWVEKNEAKDEDGNFNSELILETAGVDNDGKDLGTFKVTGLDSEINYKFDEIVAPEGYSINDGNATINWEDKENEDTVQSGTSNMVDTKLSELPSTGGMGTTIFTIAGCVIMISAAGLFFASRRKAN